MVQLSFDLIDIFCSSLARSKRYLFFSFSHSLSYDRNTIGYSYWLFRFVFQCFFYALVVTVALIQVYDQVSTAQIGLLIAIIVVAGIFLWLELLQAVHSWSRYSGYAFFLFILLFFICSLT